MHIFRKNIQKLQNPAAAVTAKVVSVAKMKAKVKASKRVLAVLVQTAPMGMKKVAVVNMERVNVEKKALKKRRAIKRCK